jgi:hypothetical protein
MINRCLGPADWLWLARHSQYVAHEMAKLLNHGLRSIERPFAEDCGCAPQK